jgi:hypothetical protein
VEKTRHDSAVRSPVFAILENVEGPLALIRLSAPSPICEGKQEKADEIGALSASALFRALLGMGEGADRRMRAH